MSTSKIVDYARWLTAVQVFRIVGALFLVEYQRGNLPVAFAIPAGVGDVLVGITAPVVALSLRRTGALGWALALTWNALGLVDLVYGVSLGLLVGATYVQTSYLVIIPVVFVPLAVILHLITIVQLSRGLRQRFQTV